MTDHAVDAFETLIVGAGPIGIELGAALRHVGAPATLVDAGPIGATIEWWAPQTTFFSSPERIAIAGVPLVSSDQGKATREQYLTYLRGVVAQHDLDVRTYRRVVDLERTDAGDFRVTVAPSDHGVGGPAELARRHGAVEESDPPPREQWRVRRLILAIGDMHRPRLVGVPGEDLPHVSHFLDDPHRSFRCRVVIVGGKNSAVEAALRLHRVGAEVTIVHRGDGFDAQRVKYWLRPELEWLIARERIAFRPRREVVEIDRAGVVVASIEHGDRERLVADRVFLLTGYEQDSTLFTRLGIDLIGDARAPRHDPATMETNVPGVYVAGTAVAGTQSRARVFIENSHGHVGRIVRAVSGREVPWVTDAARAGFSALEES